MSVEGPAERRPRRAAAVGVLALVLAVVGVADRASRRSARLTGASSVTAKMPTASAADALSSTWYCAGGSARAGDVADARVIVANPTDAEVSARVTIVADSGETKVVPLSIAGDSRAEVVYHDVLAADHAAALVDVDGGGVVVEHQVDGPLGTAASPCASSASTSWYFAEGTTAKDAQLLLSLFNPFPEDAIADLSFTTDQGRAIPADFQGIVIPAGGVTVVDVGSHVRRREAVATSVIARSGRFVVDKTQVRTAPGVAGVSLSLGSPSLGDVFYFPEGYVAPGLTERVHVYNPSEREAAVDVELSLEQGAAEPFELTVPPRGQAVVETSKESRVPHNVPYATTARVTNGVPVVVERTIEGAPPSPRTGRSVIVGARNTARQWAFAAGGPTDALDEWIVVQNPGRRDAVVDVIALAGGRPLGVEGLQGVRVPRGRRIAVRLGDHLKRPDAPIVVRSSAPVVVERNLFGVGRTGTASAIGVVLPPG